VKIVDGLEHAVQHPIEEPGEAKVADIVGQASYFDFGTGRRQGWIELGAGTVPARSVLQRGAPRPVVGVQVLDDDFRSRLPVQ
jgi:hypothetical protein